MDELLNRVRQDIEAHREELLQMLRELVRFRTPNPPGGNELEAQKWFAAQLSNLKCKVDTLFVFPNRPDVVGTWAGTGGGKSIMLSGHIDVCEDRQLDKWRHNPYDPWIEGGELYGRGVADMKGALASYYSIISCFQRLGIRLKGDVMVASVIGEERGEPGTRRVLGYRPDFAVVGEPAKHGDTLYAAVGLMNCRITVASPYTLHLQERRHFTHAGGGREGANCIEKAAIVIIPALNELEKHWAVFKNHPLMPPGQAMINVFSINGGGNTFMIPDSCTLDVTVYYYPGDDKKAVQKEVEDQVQRAAQADFWLRSYPPKFEWEPNPEEYQFLPFDLDVNTLGVKMLSEAYHEVTGKRFSVGGRGAIVDTGWFTQAGIPAVTYGPGDAYWAHRIDERIDISALTTYCQTMALFLAKWCGVEEGGRNMKHE